MKDSTCNGKLFYCVLVVVVISYGDSLQMIILFYNAKTLSKGNRSWASTPCLCLSIHKTIYTAGKICTLMGVRCLWWPGSYWFLQNVQRNRLTQFWWSALWNHLEESVDFSLLTCYPLKNYILSWKWKSFSGREWQCIEKGWNCCFISLRQESCMCMYL